MRPIHVLAVASAIMIAPTAALADFPVYLGQPLQTATGTFVDYGNGNRSGGIVIRSATGKPTIYATSSALTAGGRAVRACYTVSGCPSWPATIRAGSRVRVTFWTIPGVRVPQDAATNYVAKSFEAMP
jgi:hypothetical protein